MQLIKYTVTSSLNGFLQFDYCPFCGSKDIEVYVGDYTGYVSCFEDDCDKSLTFELLNEIKNRFPDRFRKLVEEL